MPGRSRADVLVGGVLQGPAGVPDGGGGDAADPPEGLKGLIIESGRPSLGNFTRGLEPAESQKFQDEYLGKVLSIEIPVLVIHGQMDDLAPLKDAVGMYQRFVSSDKHLLIIPGAGHNDLMHIGINEYFEAIRQFVAPKAES